MSRRNHAGLRPCPSYPGYSASDEGKIFTHWGANRHYSANHPPRELKQCMQRGYLHVRVTVDGRGRGVRVHRLVLDAFAGPRGPEFHGRHLDGDQLNNVPSNLAWGTARDNAADRKRHGRYALGSANHHATLTEAAVVQAREQYAAGRRISAIAAAIGSTYNAVYHVVRGNGWRHV